MKDTILFDFDGTIIDTNQLIARGLNTFSLRYRGRSCSQEEMKLLAGRPLADQMNHLCPGEGKRLSQEFSSWYARRHDRMTKAFPGMIALLHELKRHNIRLGLVSNNSTATVQMGLRHLGISRMFPIIVTCDDVRDKKPSPEGIRKALDVLGSHLHSTLYVGDSAGDLLAARNAGTSSALVSWTAQELNDLLKLGPDHVIHTPREILSLAGIPVACPA